MLLVCTMLLLLLLLIANCAGIPACNDVGSAMISNNSIITEDEDGD